jgi:hypothetical protein
VYNIKMVPGKRECGRVDWIDLAEDRNKCGALVNAVMKLLVP